MERRHFQWPWTTSNLVFKVSSFFDTEYLTNGYRYSHSYYRKRIGSRTPGFRMTLISMILSDLWPTFQGYGNIQRPTSLRCYSLMAVAPWKLFSTNFGGLKRPFLEQKLWPYLVPFSKQSEILVEKSQFLTRVSILTRDIDIAILSVRLFSCPFVFPFVCPSVRYVPVFYENGLTYCHSFLTMR